MDTSNYFSFFTENSNEAMITKHKYVTVKIGNWRIKMPSESKWYYNTPL